MFYRTLLSAFVITCMCTRTSSHATSKDIKKTKDVICILALSGLNKEDLDNKTVTILKKHHVDLKKLRDKNVRQECLKDLKNRITRRICDGGNCSSINEKENLKSLQRNVSLNNITETTTELNHMQEEFLILQTHPIKYKLKIPEQIPETQTETPSILTVNDISDQDANKKITEPKIEESNIPTKVFKNIYRFTENTERIYTSRHESLDAGEVTTFKYSVSDATTKADSNEQNKSKPNHSSERGGKKHTNLYWPVPKPPLEEEYRKPPDISINNEEQNIDDSKLNYKAGPDDAQIKINRLIDLVTSIKQDNSEHKDLREYIKKHINKSTIAIHQLNNVLENKHTATTEKGGVVNNHLSTIQISEIQEQINKLISNQYETLKLLNVTFMRPLINAPTPVVTSTAAPILPHITTNKYNDNKIIISGGLFGRKLDNNDAIEIPSETIDELIGITDNTSETKTMDKLTDKNDIATIKSIDSSELDDRPMYNIKFRAYSKAFNKMLIKPYIFYNGNPQRVYEDLNAKLKEPAAKDEEVDFKSIVEDNDNSTYIGPKTMMLDGNKDEQDSVFKQMSFIQDSGTPIKVLFSKNFTTSLSDKSILINEDSTLKSRRGNTLDNNNLATTTTEVVTTPTTTKSTTTIVVRTPTTTKYIRDYVKDINKLTSSASDFNQEALFNVLKSIEATLKNNNQNKSQNNKNVDDSTNNKINNTRNEKKGETYGKNNINTTPAPTQNDNNKKQYTQNPLVYSDKTLEPDEKHPFHFLFTELPFPFIDTGYSSGSNHNFFTENQENVRPTENRYKILQPPNLNPALVYVDQQRVSQGFEVDAKYSPKINERPPFNNGWKMQDPPIDINKYKQTSTLYKQFNNKFNYDDVSPVTNYRNQDGGITPTVFFDHSRTIKETSIKSNRNKILHDACKILRSSSIQTSDSLIKLCENEFNKRAKPTDRDDSNQSSDFIQPTSIHPSKLRYITYSENSMNAELNMTNRDNIHHNNKYRKDGEQTYNLREHRVNTHTQNNHRTERNSETRLKEAVAEIKTNPRNNNLNEKDLKNEIVQDILKKLKGYLINKDEKAEPKITKNTESDGTNNEKYLMADNLVQRTSLPPTTTTTTSPILTEVNQALSNMLKLFNQIQNINPTQNTKSNSVKPMQTDTQQVVYKPMSPQIQQQVYNPQIYQGMNPYMSQNLPSYQGPIVIENLLNKRKPITDRKITLPLPIQDNAINVKTIQTNQHFIPPIVQSGDAAFNNRQVIIVATHKPPLVKHILEIVTKPPENETTKRELASFKKLREERERLGIEEQLTRMVHKNTNVESSSAEKLKKHSRHHHKDPYKREKETTSNEGHSTEIKKRINSKWQQKKHTEHEAKKQKERYTLTPRLQVPLGKKTKDDKTFVNFLKTQQKVNEMLEGLLAIRNQERSVVDV